MTPDEIPRLFVLHADGLDGEKVADGVQWPDGTISVRRLNPAATESWTDWEDPAAAEVHDGTTAVVWRRQDTYTDQQEGTP
ncbi:hypothetical protein [Saccharothrix sp. HUAS TT1]|uniref:hypothetical protein n=1 Tax=unclassified Saccharothrix TaxID=2593673 RepID=UPI00345C2E85